MPDQVTRKYDRREAAEYLKIAVVTIDRAIARKEISLFRVGRRVIFDQSHLDDFLKRNECLARPKRAPRGLLGLEG